MKETPCLGCVPPKRTPTCHGTCERWLPYKEQQDQEREARLVEGKSSGHLTALDYKKRQVSFGCAKADKKRAGKC